MFSTYRHLYKLVNLLKSEYWSYRWFLLLQIILSFLSGILEGVGINAVVPVFSFINNSSGNTSDNITAFIRKLFFYFDLSFTLRNLLLFIAVLFILKAGVLYLTTYISSKINASYERNTRSRLFKLTVTANWPFLSKQNLTTDVSYSTNILNYISSVTLFLANIIVYIFISVNISPLVAILTILIGLLSFLIFKPFFYKNRIYSDKVENIFKNISHFVNESIIGIKTIKAMSTEEKITKIGDRYFEDLKKANIDIVRVRNITNSMLQPLGLIFILVIFSFFYKMTAFNFASFAVIIYAINKVFAYIQLVQTQMHGIISLLPFVSSIQKYRLEAMENKEENEGRVKFKFLNFLNFERVSFGYEDKQMIVDNVNLQIKKGEMIGLIGPSGAGKTTIVDLILRLHQPKNGIISLDGQPASDISIEEWRKHIGYVAQDNFLLNDTIENNIKFYDETITTGEVIKATRLANIYDFINEQPTKFATIVGERGVKLSGGEKQRIALARILVRHPDILILDEATSALDNESELAVQQAINNLKGYTTIIVVAHRLTTVLASDRIVAIDKGRVVEEGSPTDLAEDVNSYFYKVYNLKQPLL